MSILPSMDSPQLSIVIPTHKRSHILVACLQHVERQTIVDRVEVIVVSDGHDAETASAITSTQWTMPVTFREIPKSQQGRARNVGTTLAQADTILFINDDILLAPDACAAHLTMHERERNCAVLGHIEWDPSVGITPVMRWLDRTGWQFGYHLLTRYAHKPIPEDLQHRFTYASNLSVRTAVAKDTPFPEGLTDYGWEDIVFGMELKQRGIRLFYEPSARALHRHHIELEDSLRRMRSIGATAHLMAKRDPAFDRVPKGWKLLAYRILALFPTMRGKHAKALLHGLRGSH